MSKLIITEEDVIDMLKEAIDQVIEDNDNDDILLGIAEKITDMGEINCNIGENEINDIQIGDYNVSVDFTVESDSYWTGVGDPGDNYNEPEADFNEGETRVLVTKIWINTDEEDDVIDIEDTGVVANAIKSIAVIDEMSLPDRSFEYDEPDVE